MSQDSYSVSTLWSPLSTMHTTAPVSHMGRPHKDKSFFQLVIPACHSLTLPLPATACVHLAVQYEAGEGLLVYPVQAVQDVQAGEAPPAVAHVLQLLRPTIESSTGGLPFC